MSMHERKSIALGKHSAASRLKLLDERLHLLLGLRERTLPHRLRASVGRRAKPSPRAITPHTVTLAFDDQHPVLVVKHEEVHFTSELREVA